MTGIGTCLWFDTQAEEAATFYVSIFKNSKMIGVNRYGDAGAQAAGRPKGSVMTAAFELDGRQFLALNGGPIFQFSEAISLIVNCETQKEIDDYAERLTAGGGAIGQCGWLKDKYGLSWQIVPAAIGDMMLDKDPKKTERVMAAVLTMKKLDLARIEAAYEGR